MSAKEDGAENHSAPSRKFIHHDERRDSDGSTKDSINAQLERRREAAKRLPPLRRNPPLTDAERRAIELRAWRRTIDHLNSLGLTPMGVPADVMRELWAISDATWRRIVDSMWVQHD